MARPGGWRYLGPEMSRALAIGCLVAVLCTPAHANVLDRDQDPVVLTGAALPAFVGADPSRIVAFKYDAGWVQIPLQIDERTVVDFGQIYNTDPIGQLVLTYADPGTFTGADPDATFDDDDELVFLARDAESVAPGVANPAGVVAGIRVELLVNNPLNGQEAYVYLFETDGSLDPSAGAIPIDYNFVLLSGDYLTTYNTRNGPNPEDSTVTTGSYSVHFSDRWIRDETRVTAGGASGADILDRDKFLFVPWECGRSEDTFSLGEGAFIVNRTGPIRALRGYIGANSGPTTYRIHQFYEEREEARVVLRVHALPSLMDYFDYSPDAIGMSYHNDVNPGGVTIDGVPDAVAQGQIVWELVTGDQGTLAHAFLFTTDIPDFSYTSYYSDNEFPPALQCTGDEFEYGASGLWKDDGIPNTDPSAAGQLFRFETTRVIKYGVPNLDNRFAEINLDQAHNPVGAVVEGDFPNLSNISTRGPVSLGDAVLIGGIIIEGTAQKTVLIRALGPSLSGFDVSAPLADPLLQLFSGQMLLEQNDNWQDGARADEILGSGLAPADALESAILVTLDPGEYTAIVRGFGGAEGIALVEVYEMDGLESTKLTNLSTRGFVGIGEEALIGGFIVQGTSSKNVLVRALGPTLASFDVSGALGNPTLRLMTGQVLLAENDDWGSSPDAAEIAASGFAPPDPLESAILINLPPGEYTAVLEGVGGTTGVGLVEMYDLDTGQPSPLTLERVIERTRDPLRRPRLGRGLPRAGDEGSQPVRPQLRGKRSGRPRAR